MGPVNPERSAGATPSLLALSPEDAGPDPRSAPEPEAPAVCAAGARPVRLPVVGGGVTWVDADVAAALAGVPLYWSRRGYVRFFDGSRKMVLLHRFVARAGSRLHVHHRRSRANNRRCRLLVLTPSEHRLVEPTRRGDGASQWLGVVRCRHVWQARVKVERRVYSRSGFPTAVEAALWRDDWARSLVRPGVPICLNFPRRVSRARLRRLLEATDGRTLRVFFYPRHSEELRDMTCRVPTPLEVAARPPRLDLETLGLVSVIDIEADDYRFIALEGVLCFMDRSIWHRVGRPLPESTALATWSVRIAA